MAFGGRKKAPFFGPTSCAFSFRNSKRNWKSGKCPKFYHLPMGILKGTSISLHQWGGMLDSPPPPHYPCKTVKTHCFFGTCYGENVEKWKKCTFYTSSCINPKFRKIGIYKQLSKFSWFFGNLKEKMIEYYKIIESGYIWAHDIECQKFLFHVFSIFPSIILFS